MSFFEPDPEPDPDVACPGYILSAFNYPSRREILESIEKNIYEPRPSFFRMMEEKREHKPFYHHYTTNNTKGRR